MILTLSFLVFTLIFRRHRLPFDETDALIIPEDRHGTVQEGTLVGDVQRTENQLVVTNPEWQDDDGNTYHAMIDIDKAVPIPFRDVAKNLKRLWLIRDLGDLVIVSITDLLHGLPKRWDPPVADRGKAYKYLVSHPAQTITSALATKTGALLLVGVFCFGGMTFLGAYLLAHFH